MKLNNLYLYIYVYIYVYIYKYVYIYIYMSNTTSAHAAPDTRRLQEPAMKNTRSLRKPHIRS